MITDQRMRRVALGRDQVQEKMDEGLSLCRFPSMGNVFVSLSIPIQSFLISPIQKLQVVNLKLYLDFTNDDHRIRPVSV